jgi:hypothetical protein
MANNNGQQVGREPRSCRLQHVVTLSHKKAVVEWMTISEELDGREGLIPRTLQAFLETFPRSIWCELYEGQPMVGRSGQFAESGR